MSQTPLQCPPWCTRTPENHAAVLDGEDLIEHETLIGFASTCDAEVSVTLTAVERGFGSHGPTVFASLNSGQDAGSWQDAAALRAYGLLLLEASEQLEAATNPQQPRS